MAELKPCPFCGYKHITVERIEYTCPEDSVWFALCHGCGARSGGATQNREKAVKMWNRRATMADYISREAAISEILSDPTDEHYPSWYAEKLKQLSAADVRPAVRGEWKNGHCSNCGNDIASRLDSWTNIQSFFFCPNCGADMRRKTDSSLRSE